MTTKSVMHSVAHYLADRNKKLHQLRGAVVEKVGTLEIEYWRLEWYNLKKCILGGSVMAVNQLKVVVSILKEISEKTVPKAEDYGITQQCYYDIIEAMSDDGLLKNAKITHDAQKRVLTASIKDATITIRGMEYLHNNSTLMKTYKGLKEVREWLPF